MKTAVVHNKYRFTGNGFMRGEINKLKQQFASKGEAKDIAEGNMAGFEVEYDYPDIESMAKDKDSISTVRKGKNLGVAKKSGWFFDDYRFDFLLEGEGSGSGSMPADVSLMLTMTFPEVAKNHNADIVTSGGQTLTWNLLTAIITGQDKSIKADFRIYHKDHIIMTACAAIVMLAIAILLILKAKKENQAVENPVNSEGNVATKFTVPMISKVLLILTLLIGLFPLYSFKSGATFTEADSIAYVAGQDKAPSDETTKDKK